MSSRVFISHCGDDRAVVDRLVTLLVVSINGLDKRDIRYTSRPDTGLTSGRWINTELLVDIRNCDCFIAVVSESYPSSQYCVWELGVRLGNQESGVLGGYLKGTDLENLGNVFSQMHLLSLVDPAAVQQLLREVANAVPDEWECAPDVEDVERFCSVAEAHPPNPIEGWRKSLVHLKKGKVFLNAYGLWEEPTSRSTFQDFHPTGSNVQPVQYLWADPRSGNSIRAEIKRGAKAEDSLLRVHFHHEPDTFGCNLSIRPLNQQALLRDGAGTLILNARVAEESNFQEIGVVLRIVNGYMQHWRSSAAEILRVAHGDFQDVRVELEPTTWSLFENDGTGRAGPVHRPDFSIIASLNLELGGYRELAAKPTAGDGILEIREIRLG